MKAAVVMGIISTVLILGTAIPGYSGQSGSNTERNITKEKAIYVLNRVTPGTVLKAGLEKRDRQIIREVRIVKSIVQVDPQTGDVIKALDAVGGKSYALTCLSIIEGAIRFMCASCSINYINAPHPNPTHGSAVDRRRSAA